MYGSLSKFEYFCLFFMSNFVNLYILILFICFYYLVVYILKFEIILCFLVSFRLLIR